MRRLQLLSVAVAMAATFGIAGQSQAQTLEFVPGESVLSVGIGTLAPITTAGIGGTASFDGTTLTDSANIWQTMGSVGTALFTAVPLISNLFFTIANGPGLINTTLVAPVAGPNLAVSGALQGTEGLLGNVVVSALGGVAMIPVPLDGVVGIGGKITVVALGANIIVSGAGFGLQATVFNVTTTTTTPGLMTVTNMAGSVTAMGGIAATGMGKTIVTVVSPLRTDTGALAGVLPGFATKSFVFTPAPEPGMLLLQGAGLASLLGLAVAHRRRR